MFITPKVGNAMDVDFWKLMQHCRTQDNSMSTEMYLKMAYDYHRYYGNNGFLPFGLLCRYIKELSASNRVPCPEYIPFGVRRPPFEMTEVEKQNHRIDEQTMVSMRDILPKCSSIVKSEPPELSDIRQVVSDRYVYSNCSTPPPIDTMFHSVQSSKDTDRPTNNYTEMPNKDVIAAVIKSETLRNDLHSRCIRSDIDMATGHSKQSHSSDPSLKKFESDFKERSIVASTEDVISAATKSETLRNDLHYRRVLENIDRCPSPPKQPCSSAAPSDFKKFETNYKDQSIAECLTSLGRSSQDKLSSRRLSPTVTNVREAECDREEVHYVSSVKDSGSFHYRNDQFTPSYVPYPVDLSISSRDTVTVSRLSTLVRPISSVLPPSSSSYNRGFSKHRSAENETFTRDDNDKAAVFRRDISSTDEHRTDTYRNNHISPCNEITKDDKKTRILSPERGSDESGHDSDKEDTIIIRPRELPQQYWHENCSRTVEAKDPKCRLPCCSKMGFNFGSTENESFSPLRIPARRPTPAYPRTEGQTTRGDDDSNSRVEQFHDINRSAFSVIMPGQKRPSDEGIETGRQGSAIKVRVIRENTSPPRLQKEGSMMKQEATPKKGENGGLISKTSLLETVLSQKADLLRNEKLGLTGNIKSNSIEHRNYSNAGYPYNIVDASQSLFTIPAQPMKYVQQMPAVQCSTIDSTGGVERENGMLGLTRVANEHLGQAIAKEQTSRKPPKSKANDCLHLWEFLRDQLNTDDANAKCMEWTCRETGEFRLIKTGVVARLWGESKNRTSMTYEKMARAMRYYYKMNILEKVPHKRLHFRFGKQMLPKVLK